MSLPCRKASAAIMPKLIRSNSASLRATSLARSFSSRVKDLRQSLAGGLPSVRITRSCPASEPYEAQRAQERVKASTMLDGEERLNEEERVRPRGRGEEGVNGNGFQKGCNGSVRTSE
eukprot:3966005-Pleurochrysis_carterae.AAC.2